jgi:hypothetical protein
VLALAAERAIKRVLGVTAANLAHSILRRISKTRPGPWKTYHLHAHRAVAPRAQRP